MIINPLVAYDLQYGLFFFSLCLYKSWNSIGYIIIILDNTLFSFNIFQLNHICVTNLTTLD